MRKPHSSKDKLLQHKIGGPQKPFIDKNLQIQFPRWEEPESTTPCLNPIYPHYLNRPSPNQYFSPINEEELSLAMKEAESSYEAWRKMQRKLKEMIEAYYSQP